MFQCSIDGFAAEWLRVDGGVEKETHLLALEWMGLTVVAHLPNLWKVGAASV